MRNCLIAQSGGPTAAINATLAGIVKANQNDPYYGKIYGGLNGLEGILSNQLVDLSEMSDLENDILIQTPSSALGSCRYKLKKDNPLDFEKIFAILDRYDIETMFYIGGNDSMDTVASLDQYAREHAIRNHRFVGCPKTIDNDLMYIDHTPGFGSAAKYIASTALNTWQDYNVYKRREVFILETMGRDAGWLAASACLSGIVDIVILPEVAFEKAVFLAEVKRCLEEKNKCYIVVSEGCKYADGAYVSASDSNNDGFEHASLGGAGGALKNMIIEAELCNRCRVLNLSTSQRCSVTDLSLCDIRESFELGKYAHECSKEKMFTGKMVALKRKEQEEYEVEYFAIEADKIANFVRTFPLEWVLPNYRGVKQEALDYMRPLIKGSLKILYENGLPAYVKPYYLR